MQVSCETTPNSGAEGSWAEQLLDCVSGTEAKLHCSNMTITLLASRSPSLCLMNFGPPTYLDTTWLVQERQTLTGQGLCIRHITRTEWSLPH